jgi:CRISPR-associated protein Cas2
MTAGFTQLEDQRAPDMLHIVAYDIADPGRLRRVARLCEDFGMRVEKSLFQCDLAEAHFEEVWRELTDLINEEEDTVIAYRVCQSCMRQTRSLGDFPHTGKPLCHIL